MQGPEARPMPGLPAGTVTFLCADIEASTRLVERLGDRYHDLLEQYRRILRTAISHHRGHEVDAVGDALFAAFSRAADALAAAVEMQRELATCSWPGDATVRARVGLHSGEPLATDVGYIGIDVHRAARICAAGHGGQILLSQPVGALSAHHLPAGVSLRDLGVHRLKDLREPERLFQVLHPALPIEFAPLKGLDVLPNNLPRQLTSFVGREKEKAEIRRLLSTARLVTLTGTGGAGKTRLALQVAAELLEQYPDGVWLVELAPLSDPYLVPQAVTSALGLPEQFGRAFTETLVDHLRLKVLLVILDNCEHLVVACGELVTALLRACTNLRILATSREGLGIEGETLYPVPSLAVPDPQRLPPTEELTRYEAISLFAQRAVAVSPSFKITPQNAPAVAQVCYRLDGIPLAIELAAARVKVLAVDQIVTRLDDRFRLLTGGSRTALPRHQTLMAALDWSYTLLSEKEGTLFRRFSVLAGGCTLEAAEVVCADRGIEHDEVLDLLARLVDKSLLVADLHQVDARYRMLETIRQFGQEKLLTSGEGATVRTRHRNYFLMLAERAEPH